MPRPGLIIAGILLIGILIGSIVFVFFALPQQPQDAITDGRAGTQAPSQETRSPEVHLYKKSPRLLLLTWGALPTGTQMIDIYRSPKGKSEWMKWKTIPIIPGHERGGSIDIVVSANENLNLYTFYTQAVAPAGSGGGSSGGGSSTADSGVTVLWTSSSTVIEPLPPSSPAPTPSSAPNGSSSNTTTTSPAPSATSTPSQTLPPTMSPPVTSTPSNPNQVIYYAPDGSISGSSTIETAEAFWVRHTDRRIEVGWQNIAVGLDAAVVYRATNSSGPWVELLRQETPPTSYVIKLIDDTIREAHYYRMMTYAAGTHLKTYAPVFLSGLE